MRRLFISVHWSSDETGHENRRRAPGFWLAIAMLLPLLALVVALVALANR